MKSLNRMVSVSGTGALILAHGRLVVYYTNRQTMQPQNSMSDQGLICFLTDYSIEYYIKMKNTTQ